MLIYFIMKQNNGFCDIFSMDPLQKYKVIELGSGTGIAGIAFAKLYTLSEVIFTDYSEGSLNLIIENAKIN